MVGDVLGVLDRGSRVVYSLMTLATGCVESELDLVDAERESKDRVVCAFYDGNDLVFRAFILLSLIVSGNGDKLMELLGCDEIT